MPGPFPGMDPYLEASRYWRGVHQAFNTYLAELLNAILPEDYVARLDERLIVVPEHHIYPDIVLFQKRQTPSPALPTSVTAVMEPDDEPDVMMRYSSEMHEPFIEIRSTVPPKRVVTTIELLSHANKAAGSKTRAEYLRKQARLLCSDTSLIEIDLLHRGEHTAAVPFENLPLRGSTWDYLICLHRADGGRIWRSGRIAFSNACHVFGFRSMQTDQMFA